MIGCYSFLDSSIKTGILLGIFYEKTNSGYSVALLLPSEDKNANEFDLLVNSIPLLVLDKRIFYVVSESVVKTPIYVVHEFWFIQGYVLFRPGMEGMFRIKKQWTSDDDSILADLSEHEFAFRENDGMKTVLSIQHKLYCFRVNLCQNLQSKLKHSSRNATSIAFQLTSVSYSHMSALKRGLVAGVDYTSSERMGQSPVVSMVIANKVIKRKVATVMTSTVVENVNALCGFLGDDYYWIPILIGRQIVMNAGTSIVKLLRITFCYESNTRLLNVKANITRTVL